jgi:hypothetical protein
MLVDVVFKSVIFLSVVFSKNKICSEIIGNIQGVPHKTCPLA